MFTETVYELLKPFNSEDLPFKPTSGDITKALNSQFRFKSWFIENPVSRTLQRSFVTQLAPFESREFVVVLQTPMTISSAEMLSKFQITHVPSEDEPSTFVEKRLSKGLESRPLAI